MKVLALLKKIQISGVKRLLVEEKETFFFFKKKTVIT